MKLQWIELNHIPPISSKMILAYHRKFDKVYLLKGNELIETANRFNSASSIKWVYYTPEIYLTHFLLV